MLSRKERKRLRLEKLRKGSDEARKEYETRQEQFSQHSKGKASPWARKKILLLSGSVLAVILIAGYAVYAAASPGRFDSFAKCLSEKGATMYGAMSWCQYTQKQRAMFGKSFKYLKYEEYTEFPAASEKIRKTPTWIIDDKVYEGVQSFDRLSGVTGCAIG